MEAAPKSSLCRVSTLAVALMVVMVMMMMPAVHGQISTPCSPSNISSFTPCMNFVTNSSGNGTSPSADCCNALKALTGSGMGCLCLIVTGSVPFQIPINRTLVITLPRACNMPSVPVQCKATGAPVPAPSPASLAPTLSPASPTAGSASPPESDTTPAMTPESTPTVNSGVPPTATTGSRQVQNRSAGNRPQSFSPSLVLIVTLGIMFIKLY